MRATGSPIGSTGGGALLGVWIADDPETSRRLFELGADAVATNDPRAIVPIRDEVAG